MAEPNNNTEESDDNGIEFYGLLQNFTLNVTEDYTLELSSESTSNCSTFSRTENLENTQTWEKRDALGADFNKFCSQHTNEENEEIVEIMASMPPNAMFDTEYCKIITNDNNNNARNLKPHEINPAIDLKRHKCCSNFYKKRKLLNSVDKSVAKNKNKSFDSERRKSKKTIAVVNEITNARKKSVGRPPDTCPTKEKKIKKLLINKKAAKKYRDKRRIEVLLDKLWLMIKRKNERTINEIFNKKAKNLFRAFHRAKHLFDKFGQPFPEHQLNELTDGLMIRVVSK